MKIQSLFEPAVRAAALAIPLAFTAGAAKAAVGEDEARRLGDSLTWIGAEKAANAAGTIPAYGGGLVKPPAGYDPARPGTRPDPYTSEKPLYSIDAKNAGAHAANLTEGAKALLGKYPTFRIDVYPTQRSVAAPAYVQENTRKNAIRCKTVDAGLGVEGCHAGIPFPIPKDGLEVMWNHLLRFGGYSYSVVQRSFNVDAAGNKVMTGENEVIQEFPYYDPKAESADTYWKLSLTAKAPARIVGEQIVLIDPMNFTTGNRKAFIYLPGQRRVKLAPEIAYDAPVAQSAGGNVWDDIALFNGKMDRFDFKLVGKREVILPYNLYRMNDAAQCGDDKLVGPKHLNPDCVRWELHRVWVVEATLKAGQRHVYSRRTFYWDEDSYTAGASDEYDAAGKLYRAGFSYMTPRYEVPAPTADIFGHYDLINGGYVINSLGAETGGYYDTPSKGARWWTPDAMAGRGVR